MGAKMKSSMRLPNTYSQYANSRIRILLISCVVWGIGCGPQVSEKHIPPAELNLRFIGMAFTQFTTDKGRPPQSLDELKPALTEFGDAEQLGISPRDGKPYVIVPKGKVLAFEQVGVAGKRFVVDRRFNAWEVDEAEFRKLGLDKK